jgi:hypothetical protein
MKQIAAIYLPTLARSSLLTSDVSRFYPASLAATDTRHGAAICFDSAVTAYPVARTCGPIAPQLSHRQRALHPFWPCPGQLLQSKS